MTTIKKIIINSVGVIVALLAVAGAAHATSNNVLFDPGVGTLSISGTCSELFVLVVIRRTADNSIWGSSNPACESGSYQYAVEVPDADRTGAAFSVQTYDEASAGGGVPTASSTSKVSAPTQSVVFSELLPPTTAISIDTSSLPAAPDDQSLLATALSQFFGIIADVNDAIQNFGTIIANTVKASLIATVNLFSKNITILPGGSITLPQGANQMAGEDWLNAGATDVFILNTAVVSSSHIIITPTSPTDIPLAVTQKNDGAGFRVSAVRPPSSPISFDWLIVQTYVAGPPAEAQQSGQSSGVPVPSISVPIPAVSIVPSPTDTSSTDASSTDTATIVSSSGSTSTVPDVSSTASNGTGSSASDTAAAAADGAATSSQN